MGRAKIKGKTSLPGGGVLGAISEVRLDKSKGKKEKSKDSL